jgi:apolipoprotein D and lipocalin family protein
MKSVTAVFSALLLGACARVTPLETVEYVDLPRFMGDWYVIANIPTRLEVGAHNAVESYQLDADGSIATTFTFRADGFDGEEKRYTPRGFVLNRDNNAEWGMRFIWPIKADYRVVYLDEDYTVTIIGRNKRDYVWLMARQPSLPDARYEELLDLIAAMGYDRDKVQRVPQRW